MLNFSKFIFFPTIISGLISCSSLNFDESKLKAENLTKIIGYSTTCSGKLKIYNKEDSRYASTILLPAGEKELEILLESEPYYPERHFGHSSYSCVDIAKLSVAFEASPGKGYRLFAEQLEPHLFQITAYELFKSNSPKANSIKTNSKQLEINKRCGFYGSIRDCNL